MAIVCLAGAWEMGGSSQNRWLVGTAGYGPGRRVVRDPGWPGQSRGADSGDSNSVSTG